MNKPQPSQSQSEDYDSPWKEVLTMFFPEFMELSEKLLVLGREIPHVAFFPEEVVVLLGAHHDEGDGGSAGEMGVGAGVDGLGEEADLVPGFDAETGQEAARCGQTAPGHP